MEIAKRFRQALRIVAINQTTMKHVSQEPHSLAMGMNIAAIGGVIGGFANILLSGSGISSLVISPIFSIVSVFLLTLLVHAMAKIMGGKASFQELFRPMLYLSILTWLSIVKLIPGLGIALDFVIGVWTIGVSAIIVKNIYGFGFVRSALAVLVPLLFLGVLLIFLNLFSKAALTGVI